MDALLQAIYEEDLVHRLPGDAGTLGRLEQPFPVARQWVESELADQQAGHFLPPHPRNMLQYYVWLTGDEHGMFKDDITLNLKALIPMRPSVDT